MNDDSPTTVLNPTWAHATATTPAALPPPSIACETRDGCYKAVTINIEIVTTLSQACNSPLLNFGI